MAGQTGDGCASGTRDPTTGPAACRPPAETSIHAPSGAQGRAKYDLAALCGQPLAFPRHESQGSIHWRGLGVRGHNHHTGARVPSIVPPLSITASHALSSEDKAQTSKTCHAFASIQANNKKREHTLVSITFCS